MSYKRSFWDFKIFQNLLHYIQHNISMVRSKGERRSEPHSFVSATSEMNSVLSEHSEEPVSGYLVRKINGTECPSAPGCGEKSWILGLELFESCHHHWSGLSNPLKQIVLNNSFYNLEISFGLINSIIFISI